MAFVVFIGIYMAIGEPNGSHVVALLIRTGLGILGAVESIAGIAIFLSMLFYLFLCDDAAGVVKVLWLLLFFLTGPVGTIIYFFSAYRKPARGGVAEV